MTKPEIKKIVAKKSHITLKIADEVIDNFLREIKIILIRGESVRLYNFGIFHINKVVDKVIVPFGDESRRSITKAHKVIHFKPEVLLRKKAW